MNLGFCKKVFTGVLGFGIIVSGTGFNKAEASNPEKSEYSLEQATDLYSKKLNENSDSDDLVAVLKSVEESNQVESLSNNDKLDLLNTIVESVPEEVAQQYQNEKLNEISEALSDESNVNSEGPVTIELSDGSSVDLSSTDEVDYSNSSSIQARGITSTQMGLFWHGPKDYGSRLYTAWVKLKSLGVTVATLKLGNHYSVGDYGLKMRYCSVAGTKGTVYSSVDASCDVTDSKAEKVNYDMNAVGNYKLTGAVTNGYVSLTSSLKLTKLNKTSKYARVYSQYTYRD
ncbi:hypothetical protein [Peribacillus frigoritolerans]|uniref:hypothetical protein n=1 Tax=Peribacillus frigoritolerans TaxID=450367 RepID=UPI0022322506|nr:hypothetical protein [Peribacillus frigoritolerans]UZD48636.1 hypothetical protein OMJ04_09225 [Peribacillus frigoritolerans]